MCSIIYVWPSMPIKVNVERIFSILRIFQVIVSRMISTLSASTFASISYAPKVPCTSITSLTKFNFSITDSSEPLSQFIKTNASDMPCYALALTYNNIDYKVKAIEEFTVDNG